MKVKLKAHSRCCISASVADMFHLQMMNTSVYLFAYNFARLSYKVSPL